VTIGCPLFTAITVKSGQQTSHLAQRPSPQTAIPPFIANPTAPSPQTGSESGTHGPIKVEPPAGSALDRERSTAMLDPG
jgi:hypothetical protein